MKTNIKKLSKVQVIIVIIVAVFAVIFIGGGIYCAVNDETPAEMFTDVFTSNDKQIVGKWQNSSTPGLSAYEFYDDGTYDSYLSTFAFTGEYKIEGSRITLSNPNSNKSVVYKYSLNGDKLTMKLVEEEGQEVEDEEKNEFKRVKYLNMKDLQDIIGDLADGGDSDNSEEETTEEPTTGYEVTGEDD